MKTVKNNILVPFDFSELSLIAMRESFKYAKFSDAKIILLHIFEETFSEETNGKLNRIAEDFETESGLKVGTLILKGKTREKINEAVELVSAKLIVMGLNPSSIGIKTVFGHSIFKLINKTQCPVITVKKNLQHEECKNIVLPIDLTKESREKVGKAVELAKFYHTPIRLVSVFSPNEIKLENRLLAYADQAKRFIRGNGVACSNKTIEGNDRAQIVIDYANKMKADLIIITTQFASSIKEFLKGTVSQQIINLSNIPVMSLPPMLRKDTTSFVSSF